MKKKGFTLIELLAVIVVLAIIAFILIPVIQDLISNARYASAADSVLNYVHAANTQAAVDAGGFEEYKLNLSDTFELETDIDDFELSKIKYSGKGPDYVYLLFSGEHKYVSEAHFCMWGYSIDYNFETGTSKSDINYCGETEPEGEATCDVLNGNKYDSTEVFKINNIEDLVCVSELAKTKTFENKTIYLLKDLDFNSTSSYANPNNTSYGDINGNGETEGLKDELTTGSGFYPIGSSDTPFKGMFEGYTKSISNLMINRSQNNVGLFGYNQGKIQGFTISGTVIGSTSVGSIAGVNEGGTVNEIIADVTVKSSMSSSYGDYRVGGVVGHLNGGNVTSILVKNTAVSIPGGSYGNDIAGVVGKSSNASNVISVIVEACSVKNGDNPYTGGGWRVGRIAGQAEGTITSYISTNAVGGASGVTGYNGSGYTLNDEILNAYDKILDTYIGGDNDDSGYYFDYENEDSSNIIIKRTTKNPIKFTLAGKGTESNPYILDSVQHFKEASTLSGNGNNYYFKLTEDIDFTDRHYYALGTNGNAFNGSIDGDLHTLSNISFNCAENCGLIGRSSNTIKSLRLDNIKITSGNEIVGGLVAYNEGTIKGITATGLEITGPSTVGGIVGYNDGGSVNDVIADVTVKTNLSSSYSELRLGGIAGHLESGSVTNALIKNFNILLPAGTYGNDLGGIVGRSSNESNVISGVIEAGYIKTGNNVYNGGGWRVGKAVGKADGTVTAYVSGNTYGTASGYNGTTYQLNDEILNAYDKVLDTYIGGDNDDSEYYFDYENEESSNIVLKRTSDYPITFTLSGHGTSGDPYIIDSYQHFKEATTLAGDGNTYKFKITNDIDFSGKHYYSLGTLGNPFSSDIDGDMHTLSNISFSCVENCGLISKNISNTIEGLNLNNINISSSGNTVGGLVGYNEGTIKGINASNINVIAESVVGGIVGQNNGGEVNEVSADVTVRTSVQSSYSDYRLGGIVGYLSSGRVTNVLLRKSEILLPAGSYSNNLGGIVGISSSDDNVITGAVETGAIKTGNNIYHGGGWKNGKIAGQSNGTINAYASDKMQLGAVTGYNGIAYTLVPPTTVTYTENSNTVEVDTLTYYDSVGVLDTVIGGDGDGSGYYFQYNNSGDAIIVVKSGTSSGTGNPSSNPTTPTIGEAIEETKVGDNPPTCVLERVISRDSGLQPVLTCTDEEGAPTIRSQWNVNKNATTNQFSDIGIVKNGTVNGNSKTVRPYWSTSDPISVPIENTCYYFRFGAQDASGNWSYYVTTKCYYGFGRSND